MSDHIFALSVEMPDDEPRQIVCTGEEAGADIWQPAFGVWEADDFGIDADETVGDGERLYVSRRIYDALTARLSAAEAMAEALKSEIEARNLYLSTAPDRGGSHGPKGQRRMALENAQLQTVFALKAWEAGK